jgi:hypothetical protein
MQVRDYTFEDQSLQLHVDGKTWWVTRDGKHCTVRDWKRPGFQLKAEEVKKYLDTMCEVAPKETPPLGGAVIYSPSKGYYAGDEAASVGGVEGPPTWSPDLDHALQFEEGGAQHQLSRIAAIVKDANVQIVASEVTQEDLVKLIRHRDSCHDDYGEDGASRTLWGLQEMRADLFPEEYQPALAKFRSLSEDAQYKLVFETLGQAPVTGVQVLELPLTEAKVRAALRLLGLQVYERPGKLIVAQVELDAADIAEFEGITE